MSNTRFDFSRMTQARRLDEPATKYSQDLSMLKKLLTCLLLGCFLMACGGDNKQLVTGNTPSKNKGNNKNKDAGDKTSDARDASTPPQGTPDTSQPPGPADDVQPPEEQTPDTTQPDTTQPDNSAAEAAVDTILDASRSVGEAQCECYAEEEFGGDVEACLADRNAQIDASRACQLNAIQGREAEFANFAECMQAASNQYSVCMSDCKEPDGTEGMCETALMGDMQNCQLGLSDELRDALGAC